ncbi:GPW/gp25 family protein [Acinetobacter schindleri]|uniref:GPW/gp25 family protein n=1 Tax=Acinetobacter schindleri TaxID=108981 RepID=UPI00209B087A|nr:GPW/gp25 family protein [Acinetobacter schindleri]MCO8066809.1 GPW/gp25 family protein [Acinetobacter schindleri]WBX38977.1 GPW/gp25 family protein [Acinetobacter schindleri]
MMSRYNGSELTELEHIRQSLEDIATTPIGSRLMRREYGTLLASLMDQPIGQALYLKIYSTLYSAYVRWEDRIEISQISVAELNKGQLILDVIGFLKTNGNEVNMSIPVKLGAIS